MVEGAEHTLRCRRSAWSAPFVSISVLFSNHEEIDAAERSAALREHWLSTSGHLHFEPSAIIV